MFAAPTTPPCIADAVVGAQAFAMNHARWVAGMVHLQVRGEEEQLEGVLVGQELNETKRGNVMDLQSNEEEKKLQALWLRERILK